MSDEHETSALDTVALLRRLVDVLPQYGPDGEAAAAAIVRYLREAQDGMTLDRAFGVAATKGEWPWWRVERHERARQAGRKLIEACGAVDRAFEFLNRFSVGRGRLEHAPADFSDPRAQAAAGYLAETGGRVPASARTLERAGERDS